MIFNKMKGGCMKEENLIEETSGFFGLLYPYITSDDITDVDYNGKNLWITYSNNMRKKVQEEIDDEFVEQFSSRVSNAVSKPFNKQFPILEAETNYLRITIVHEAVAVSGRCFCIRKSLPSVRLSEETIISSGYLRENVFSLLKNAVKAKMNIVFCGEPGAGKTECAKFFSTYINENDKVITIEDTIEWHYGLINNAKDVVELQVNNFLNYTDAIKTSLRLNPKWLMLSEVRSTEVKHLLECFSTGISGMTTLHTDDVSKIPDRMLNMAKISNQNMENDIYSFVDVGILIKRKEILLENGYVIKRYVDQVCFFVRDKGENSIVKVVENGQVVTSELPESVLRKFKEVGVDNPFYDDSSRDNYKNISNRTVVGKNGWTGGGTYYAKKEII